MGSAAKVLIVEDCLEDLQVVEQAFRHPSGWDVRVALDGVEALAILGILESKDDSWRPNLIVLDTNLPKMDGHGILEKIRQHPDLAPTPVVMWTISCAWGDIELAYRLGVAAYFIKPVDTEELLAQTTMIREFFDKSQLYECELRQGVEDGE